MITERMIKRLDSLVAKYSYQDYRATCRKRWYRPESYTLSETTNEARGMRNLALKRENVTLEEEERIKAYLTRKLMTGEMDDILELEKEEKKYDPESAYNDVQRCRVIENGKDGNTKEDL